MKVHVEYMVLLTFDLIAARDRHIITPISQPRYVFGMQRKRCSLNTNVQRRHDIISQQDRDQHSTSQDGN